MKKETPFKIEWEAHNHEYKERSPDWFWAMGIVTVSIAITAIIFHNIIFAILVLVSAFALALFINRDPEIVEVQVNEKGVTKGQVYYPYESLHSFVIDTEHSHPKVMLRSQKVFLPLIIIPLGHDVNVSNLREKLHLFLPEEQYKLPFVETVLEYLGF